MSFFPGVSTSTWQKQQKTGISRSCTSDCIYMTLNLYKFWWHSALNTIAVTQFRVCVLRRSIWRQITSQRRTKAVPIRRLLQTLPSFPCFWRMHRYDPLWPRISQDSLRALKRWKKKGKWRHCMAQIVNFVGLGGRNRELQINYLPMKPGNAPKARLRRLQRPGPSKDADPELRHSNYLREGFAHTVPNRQLAVTWLWHGCRW